MYVVKQKPHDKFKRRGADLIVEQEITLEEALVGGKFTIDHLGGKKTTLVLEPGRIVKPTDILMVDGLGMPDFKAPGNFGKLYLIISVKFPTAIEESKLATLLKVLLFIFCCSGLTKEITYPLTNNRALRIWIQKQRSMKRSKSDS